MSDVQEEYLGAKRLIDVIDYFWGHLLLSGDKQEEALENAVTLEFSKALFAAVMSDPGHVASILEPSSRGPSDPDEVT